MDAVKPVKKRIYYLDYLRTFAIVMVVLIHCMSNYITVPEYYGSTSWYIYIVLNAITRAGVPVFLMISGYLMLSSEKEESLWQFYKKRIPRLLIPLVAWNIICFLYRYWLHNGDGLTWKLLREEFFYQGTFYHMWYMYTLVGLYLLAPFLKMIVQKCTLNQVWVLVGVMALRPTIIPLINKTFDVFINWFDPLVNGYVTFFVLGYLLGKIEIKKKNIIIFAILGVVGFTMSVWSSNYYSSKEGIDMVYNYGSSFCHMALAASIFFFARLVDKGGWVHKVCAVISKASLGIYLVHVLVLDHMQRQMTLTDVPIVCTLKLFVILFPVSFAISFILGKIKYVEKIVS